MYYIPSLFFLSIFISNFAPYYAVVYDVSIKRILQVEDKYTRILHAIYVGNMNSGGGKNSHRSKSHQQSNQSPYDKMDGDNYSKHSNRGEFCIFTVLLSSNIIFFVFVLVKCCVT